MYVGAQVDENWKNLTIICVYFFKIFAFILLKNACIFLVSRTKQEKHDEQFIGEYIIVMCTERKKERFENIGESFLFLNRSIFIVLPMDAIKHIIHSLKSEAK